MLPYIPYMDPMGQTWRFNRKLDDRKSVTNSYGSEQLWEWDEIIPVPRVFLSLNEIINQLTLLRSVKG